MSEPINHNRRGFLTRLRKPVESMNQPETTPRLVARPPHAVDEALFSRLCDGCGRCQSACSNGVIELNANLAQLNLDYNECSLCEECVSACPTDALHASIPVEINLRPQFAEICNNYLQTECRLCKSSCSQKAITIEADELPNVKDDVCNGCGQCRNSCYIGAITMGLYNN
ncbi:ferredoxin-type protein NapF [Vibrio maritimus]|uniref:ferredoxin-type protein NapF n=1 Tax=Vibrio maritimus TaxID=990268 RepID=UPI0040693568